MSAIFSNPYSCTLDQGQSSGLATSLHQTTVFRFTSPSHTSEEHDVCATRGSFLWCWALAYAGFKLGENWPSLRDYFHKFDYLIGIVIVAAGVWFIRDRWKNRIRAA